MENYMKEIGPEEMEAVAGGVLDEEEKKRLLAYIRFAKTLPLPGVSRVLRTGPGVL